MNPAFQQFKDDKDYLKNVMKEDRASITLEWYRNIQVMLESDQWENSHQFLQSVLEFIEEKEYITDKQVDTCIMILGHPDYFSSNDILPF